MISITDEETGQLLQFPDDTPEEVIRAAIARVRAGTHHEHAVGPDFSDVEGGTSSSASTARQAPSTFDLSHLQREADRVAAHPGTLDLSGAAARHSYATSPGADPSLSPPPYPPNAGPQPPPLHRSEDYWRSVTGSDNPEDWSKYARNAQLSEIERGGTDAMSSAGFQDRGMYYENPDTGERYLKHHKSGAMPSPPGPFDDLDAQVDASREFLSGIPARVAGSVTGTVSMPVRAVEASGAGLRAEIENLLDTRHGAQPPGSGLRRGFVQDWQTNPVGTGSDLIQRNVVDPARERLLDASIRAGDSPLVAAGTETGQAAAGEVLNPLNWVGPGELIEALRGAKALSPAAVRAAELESAGGARAIEDSSGLVTREFGRGSAPSEIAQQRLARDLAVPREPLLYLDRSPDMEAVPVPSRGPFGPIKGRIPDAIGDFLDQPWRTYNENVPLDRPSSVAPRPRNVDRDPLPLPEIDIAHGVSDDGVRQVAGLWDYASRRYPAIASRVKKISISPYDAHFNYETGELAIPPDADLGLMMHEMTHAAQSARGNIPDSPVFERRAAAVEPYSVRAEEVYRRAAQPLPKHLTPEEVQALRAPGQQALDEWVAEGKGTGSGPGLGSGSTLGSSRLSGSGEPVDLIPLSKREYFNAFNDESIQPTGGIRSDGEARAYTAWLEKNGMNPDHVERFGESPELEQRFFDLHNPDIGPEPEVSQSELARIGAMNQSPGPETGLTATTTTPAPETPPMRLYAGGPPPAPTPPPPLTEQQVAGAMGWDVPSGSPRAISDPIRTANFQTNLAAQLGGGPESDAVAQYIVDRSDEVFRAIGPPQSWDTLEEMAARLGRTKESFLADSSHWSVLSPEARLRLTYVIKGNEQRISELQTKLTQGAATDVDKAELLHAIETRGSLIQLGAKSGSAYGRALNSLKAEARLALGDAQMARQQLYRQYAKQLDAEKPLMDALARLDPNDPNEMQAFLRNVNKPTLREFIQEFWVSSILSSPASHERNLIGNSVNAILENAVVRPTAAMWDAARVAGTDAQREVFFRETPEALVGLGRGLRQGLRRGLEVVRRGYDPDTMKGKLFPVRSAFARSQNRIVREYVGPVVTMPLRLLSASDTVAKTMNWTAEIYAQAARTAGKEGLSGKAFSTRVAELVSTPTDEMRAAADSFALKATFNDDMSAFGKAVQNIRDIPKAQSSNRAVQFGYESYRTGMGFLLPFLHIADRLMVRGLEYSPMSIATSIGARASGNFAESADLAARASIGSLVMAYSASLAMEGRIHGAAPSNEAEKAAFYGANKLPWSVVTHDGNQIPFGQLQPIGTALALVSAFHGGWSENPDSDWYARIGHGAAQVGKYVTDQSYLDALAKAMDTIDGGPSAGRSFADFSANTAWGFVPYSGLMRTVARGVDPRIIDTKSMSDRLTQNMPVASLGLNAKLDPWGEEIVPSGGRLRTVIASGSLATLAPAAWGDNINKIQENPLDQELGRLGMPLGYVGNSLTDHKKKITLSQDEHYLYQQMAGRASKLLLQELFAKEGYTDLDPEEQRSEATKAIGAARKFARIVVLRYHNGAADYPGMNPSLGLIGWVNDSGSGSK